jgi:hypothetical protein
MAIPQILDHLVYEVPDLEAGVAAFAERTGVTPVFGGRHVGLGTANYLVRLEPQGWVDEDRPRTYLEILGPDPEQEIPAGTALPLGVHTVTEPVLRTWAVRPQDFDAAVQAAADSGADVGEVRDMSRRDPEGTLLEWRLTSREELPHDGLQPFLIDWQQTRHPSQADLPVLTLESFEVLVPEPEDFAAVLGAVGAPDTEVAQGDGLLRAVLAGPTGSVEL